MIILEAFKYVILKNYDEIDLNISLYGNIELLIYHNKDIFRAVQVFRNDSIKFSYSCRSQLFFSTLFICRRVSLFDSFSIFDCLFIHLYVT